MPGGSLCIQQRWHALKIRYWLPFFVIVVSFLAANATSWVRAQDNGLDSVLNAWIEDDLHFLQDVNNNRQKLAIRRRPVRAHIHSEDQSIADHIMLVVNLFSQAAGVPVEFTSLDPNLMAVVTSPINEGRKPNRDLLKRLGLPDSAADSLIANSDWGSGCGLYAYADLQGEISLTLAVADKNLSASDLKDCVTEGVIRAFGLRTKRTSTVRSADGYFQYLILARALRYCDAEVREGHQDIEILRPSYVRCAKEFIKKLMTQP